MNQHHESISLTAGIFLIDKKIMDQLWSVWDEMFKVPKTRKYHIAVCRMNERIEYNICMCGKQVNINYLTVGTYRWCKWPRRHCGAHNCDGAPGKTGSLA